MYRSACSWLSNPDCTSSSMPTDPLPSTSTCLNTAHSASNSDWQSSGGVLICFRRVVLMLALIAAFMCSTSPIEAHGHMTRRKSSMEKELFLPSKTLTSLSTSLDMLRSRSSVRTPLGFLCISCALLASFFSSRARWSQCSRNSPMETLPELSSSSSLQTDATISTSSSLPTVCVRFFSSVKSLTNCGSSALSTMKVRKAKQASLRAAGNFCLAETASTEKSPSTASTASPPSRGASSA
mmetsp:Transcript_1874/g.4092  ORF Transcript_1874/g.4092 Transcript_1874/m.4092 type:complete len:239 (+) Transcript_1874:252-968(+)